MNKTALKNFATKARRELLEKVELQARKIGITRDSIQKANVESSDAIYIDGRQLSDIERKQRNKLIARIEEIGFDQVMEETAYTWFNRFIALRFMEVNDYLPTKIRVLSSSNPASSEPDMMKEALSLDLDIDKEYVYELKLNNKTDELFKYLIKVHCNDLNRYMPFMFETIEDYTEILFPEGLLSTDSFIREMTNPDIIPEEDWEKVEIIGWLYQYYIAEENERVIQAKKRYKKEEIPYATQLFTPEWIVRYMVQNSLGRYWIESYPEHRDLIENWEFYLENPNPESDWEEKLKPYINKELRVEDIKCFDPAMGSGHILVYMFDVLYEIYQKCGYFEREIPRLIIENNLYGLDIDDRAYQLACFSVVMKALQYNRRFLRSIERDGLKLNLAAIQETNNLTHEDITYLAGELLGEKLEKMKQFINQFKDAKAIGSLIKIVEFDIEFLTERLKTIEMEDSNLFELERKDRILPLFRKLIKQATIMSRKYDIFVTNPPYAGRRYLTKEITDYIDEHYEDVKSDLFSSFIDYSFSATKENGQIGFMTPFVWMFISSYEKLRKKMIKERNISSLVQLEYSGFDGATVPICTFTLRNYNSGTSGEYVRLSDFRGAENQPIKTLEAVQNPFVHYRYTFNQENYNKIPGSPIAYWISEKYINIFLKGKKLKSIGDTRQGMATSDNNRFLRLWHEVSQEKMGIGYSNSVQAKNSKKKWFPYNKGGEFRKWYGNIDYVINYENDGYEVKEYAKKLYKTPTRTIKSISEYFKKCVSWSKVSSGDIAFRFYPQGFIFDVAGCCIFFEEEKYLNYLLGFLNTKVNKKLLEVISPTLNYEAGHIATLPIIFNDSRLSIINQIVVDNIEISKKDWDFFENSWDFTKHPLLLFPSNKISSSFEEWQQFSEERFNQVKENEEELNRIFIEIYGLQDELTPDVADEDVTVRKADLERDIKSFISYAIGCAFGRYSLDEEGLIYAGGEFDPTRYQTFPADQDNILPILPDAYFDDDIVFRFIKFVEVIYGQETLEENLDFIADVLGRKKNETSRETIRRYFVNDFYKDHVQTYKKRPIYWLFTSGKEKAFNCLIYMHRYDKTTLSRIRTDYLHEVQNRYEARKQDLINIIEGDSTSKEIRDAKKELKSIEKKIDELIAYDEKLHHMADQQIEIDLDDGVKVNYEKFKGLVAKL
ncbi:BREX-1 system adenine-specific DNA-methyltransferase PglX [Caldifermentibacillus hisashii]|uniref:BREX-1 system adenine-specific DNA-methyltransferase PglX n=1 Tax=Caldifermentibacillus hisashii TaxID=996558 RepID=UPI0034D4CDF8